MSEEIACRFPLDFSTNRRLTQEPEVLQYRKKRIQLLFKRSRNNPQIWHKIHGLRSKEQKINK